MLVYFYSPFVEFIHNTNQKYCNPVMRNASSTLYKIILYYRFSVICYFSDSCHEQQFEPIFLGVCSLELTKIM